MKHRTRPQNCSTFKMQVLLSHPVSFMPNLLAFKDHYGAFWASLVAQLVKNLPAMQETPVWFLGWEDPLEKGYATHTSIHGLP